jgi:ubiquinone/menaquinone biosynthesis C-methylase UbiE
MSHHNDRMSNIGFRLMALTFKIAELLNGKRVDRRVQTFGIEPGMTVIDYACGPGRYAVRYAKLVGGTGKVYAVDIHPLAIEAVEKQIARRGLANITPVLADGYNSTLPDHTADLVTAIDVFFAIKDTLAFLGELKRITKLGGTLVIDPGHEPMSETKQKIAASGLWEIIEEAGDHLKCRPI